MQYFNDTDLTVKPEDYPKPAKGGPFVRLEMCPHPEKGNLSISAPRKASFIAVQNGENVVSVIDGSGDTIKIKG